MNTQNSPFNTPRKELTSRLQKGVMIVLFMLLLVFGVLYMMISTTLEKQNAQQESLREFFNVVHHAKEHWLALLLIEEKQIYVDSASMSPFSHLHQMLVNEYRLIEDKIGGGQTTVGVDLSDTLVLLEQLSQRELSVELLSEEERISVYASFKVLEILGGELLQIGVDLDYERHVFIESLVWVPVGVLLFIAFIIIAMAIGFSRQLRSGFSSLHYILDHHKHGHALVVPPRNVVDEFTDLSHFIDDELVSRSFDLNLQNENLKLIEKVLVKIEEPFFVTNNEGDITWLSAGAERLWFRNTFFFESMFGIESGLDGPTGGRVADSVLFADDGAQINLSDGVYWLEVCLFEPNLETDNGGLQRLILIKPKSEMAELDVLHHSLKLMEQDVWNVPVRLLREDSPYISFSRSLEVVRRKVVMLFNALNMASYQTNSFEKITKLQQIASLIDEKVAHNELLGNDIVAVDNALPEVFQVELNDMAWLSKQVRDSLLLGYELVLQRLALVEKDLSSDVFLLGDVDRCLNDVRAGVLSSLSATEGESESIRRRFSIDLDCDISKVQEQIEGMKLMADSTLSLLQSDRSVGIARLGRARDSINEIVERIHELMIKTASSIPKDNSTDDTTIKKIHDE